MNRGPCRKEVQHDTPITPQAQEPGERLLLTPITLLPLAARPAVLELEQRRRS